MIFRDRNTLDTSSRRTPRPDGSRVYRRHLHSRFRGPPSLLLSLVQAEIERLYLTRPADRAFTAEEIALSLGYRPHVIRHALHRLNLTGHVLQPLHHAPHDSTRDPWGFPGTSGWLANLYFLRQPAPNAP